jgi:hypothetical protein
MTKVTLAQCEAALRKHGGIINRAAIDLGIDRATLFERIERNPRLQKAKAECEEVLKDTAEGVIGDQLKAGDKQTSQWYLAQKGKDRGYGNPTLDDGQIAAILGRMGAGDIKKLAE